MYCLRLSGNSMAGLSLVVTSYNSEALVDRFCDWLSSASQFLDQIIIVDDCSTDSTTDKIHNRLSGSVNYEFYQINQNSGRPSMPRNLGISKVKFGRIVFLDIDDCLPIQYLRFLSDCPDEHIYTGVKLVIPYSNYNYNYCIDFNYREFINRTVLDSKNMVVFSGSSLPRNTAIKYAFESKPLEDWLYWREILSAEENVKILKLLDVPIYYDSTPSLSPKKLTQVTRVLSESNY